MSNNLLLAEQNFEAFLPIVRSCYPEGKLDKAYAKKLVEAYQTLTVSDDVMVALYDNSNACIFFISENVEKITGIKASKLIKWGSVLLFKILHYSHYSFAFKATKRESVFVSQQPIENQGKNTLFCSGLKMKDGNGKIRKAFLKGKQIQVGKKGYTNISVFFIEEVTHLVKGDNYWFRLECGQNTFAYIHQRGKKVYTDILTDREKEILRLLAKNKTSQEIAEALFISKLTVETHKKNMIKRTGAINSTAMVHLCKMANLL